MRSSPLHVMIYLYWFSFSFSFSFSFFFFACNRSSTVMLVCDVCLFVLFCFVWFYFKFFCVHFL